MKRRKGIVIILILVICSISFSSLAEEVQNVVENTNQNQTTSNTVQTQTQDLQNIHKEAQDKLNEANNKMDNVQSDLSEALQNIQSLSEKITNYETEMTDIDQKVEELNKQIAETEEKLRIAQLNSDKYKKLLEDRLITLYEAGDTTFLDVLLKSRSITDFISNYYLLSEITEYDSDFLDQIEKEKAIIAISKEQLQNQKLELKNLKENKERQSIALANMKIVKDKEVEKLSEEEKKIQQEIDNYEQAVKSTEVEIASLLMANATADYTGGIMAWPVPGYTRITSPFGMRVHPITGVYKLHTGMDIGAPMGTNFIAANDGIVVKASYNAAYGNMVIIDHGGGISTLYGHGSEILVTVGQQLKRGEAVLKVGSTGYSTGPHAHFEVRVNGECVSPIPYLKSKEDTEESNE